MTKKPKTLTEILESIESETKRRQARRFLKSWTNCQEDHFELLSTLRFHAQEEVVSFVCERYAQFLAMLETEIDETLQTP